MSRTYLVVPDQHAHPDFNNDRAVWLGQLIKDLRPDVVVNMGDAADMPSLSGYDKGKASFHGRRYEADIESHLDFQDKMWAPVRKTKKKQPYRVVLEGNHEQRMKRALEYQPELGGDRYGMSFRDFEFDKVYHEVIEYNGSTPGIWTNDGISFSHYFVSGVMGRPISGLHHAASLVSKNYCSCVAAHSHTVDWSVRTRTDGRRIMGLVAGCYQDYESPWAGAVNKLWWPGVVVLKDVEDGMYDPTFISLANIRRMYQ